MPKKDLLSLLTDTPDNPTTLDTVVTALSKPGGLARASIFTGFEEVTGGPRTSGEDVRQTFEDIALGRKRFDFGDLKTGVEERLGIDLTVGPKNPADQTAFETGANLTIDILGDIITSPETFVGIPPVTKVMKFFPRLFATADKTVDAVKGLDRVDLKTGEAIVDAIQTSSLNLANPVVKKIAEKAVDRGAVGGVIGASFIDDDDSAADIAKKIGAGLGIGASLGPAGMGLAAGLRRTGDSITEAYFNGRYKKILNQVNDAVNTKKNNVIVQRMKELIKDKNPVVEEAAENADDLFVFFKERMPKAFKKIEEEVSQEIFTIESPSKLFEIMRKNDQKSSAIARSYFQRANKLTKSGTEADDLISLSSAERQIYDDIIKEAQDNTIDIRNELGKLVDNADELGFPEIKDILGSVQKRTHIANEKAQQRVDKMLSLLSDHGLGEGQIVRIKDAVTRTKFFNQRIMNEYAKASMARLPKRLQESYEAMRGFDYYSPEFIDKNFSLVDEVEDIVTGFQKREGVIEEGIEGLTREQRIELGGRRYASGFADNMEKQAKIILTKVMDDFGKAKGASAWRKGFTDTFDSITGLMKSGQLVLNSSWMLSQYLDNLGKAYIERGAIEAGLTGGKIAAGILRTPVGGGLAGFVAGAGTGSEEDFDISQVLKRGTVGALAGAGLSKGADTVLRRFKMLEGIHKQTDLVPKLMSLLDPAKSLNAVDIDSPIVNLVRDTGIIDSDRFREARDAFTISPELRAAKGEKGAEEFLQQMEKRGIVGSLLDTYAHGSGADKLNKFLKRKKIGIDALSGAMWNSGPARLASTIETAFKTETFKNILKTELEEFPAIFRRIRDGETFGADALAQLDVLKIMKRRGDKLSKREEVLLIAGEAIDAASDITKRTFFDYGAISMFEKSAMRRIFPYWVFMSRNLRYWGDALLEPSTAARATNLIGAVGSVGQGRTDLETLGLPSFAQAPGRVLSDEGLTKEIINIPQFSFFDAVSLGKGEDSLNRMNPIFKAAAERFITGKTIGDISLLPSDTSKHATRVFRAGEIPWALGMSGVEEYKGKLYATTDEAAKNIAIKRNFIPMPIVDMAFNIRRQTSDDTKTLTKKQAILNAFSPFKIKELTTAQLLRQRDQELRKRNLGKRAEEGEEILPRAMRRPIRR